MRKKEEKKIKVGDRRDRDQTANAVGWLIGLLEHEKKKLKRAGSLLLLFPGGSSCYEWIEEQRKYER